MPCWDIKWEENNLSKQEYTLGWKSLPLEQAPDKHVWWKTNPKERVRMDECDTSSSSLRGSALPGEWGGSGKVLIKNPTNIYFRAEARSHYLSGIHYQGYECKTIKQFLSRKNLGSESLLSSQRGKISCPCWYAFRYFPLYYYKSMNYSKKHKLLPVSQWSSPSFFLCLPDTSNKYMLLCTVRPRSRDEAQDLNQPIFIHYASITPVLNHVSSKK